MLCKRAFIISFFSIQCLSTTVLFLLPFPSVSEPVWPDWAIFCTLGNFLKPLATINLPKSLTFLGNFYKVAKMYDFSCEIIFGQFLWTFGYFFSGHTEIQSTNFITIWWDLLRQKAKQKATFFRRQCPSTTAAATTATIYHHHFHFWALQKIKKKNNLSRFLLARRVSSKTNFCVLLVERYCLTLDYWFSV